MSGEHTQGPWHIVLYGDGNSRVIHSDENTRVCFMASALDGDNAAALRINANAHLIAAAPDLLAALEGLLPELDIEIEARQLGGNAEDWADIERLTDAARAAIARAKGVAA